MKLSEHFDSTEFACRCGCGGETVDQGLIARLEEMRAMAGGQPLVITSGFRCLAHNREVGGVPGSPHTEGKAADIGCSNGFRRYELVSAAVRAGFTGIGVGVTYVHVDVDKGPSRPSLWGYGTRD